MGRIVVGVDGSEHSHAAVRWAAEHAKALNATLHLVHSWHYPPPMPAPDGSLMAADIEGTAQTVLDEAAALVGAGVEVKTEIANALPGRALVEASEGADLVVVGARGRGGFAGLLLGSVSQQVAHHGKCPIVIIPSGRG